MKPFSKIYCVDCELAIPKLPDNSVDMCICSPPFNVNLGDNKYNKTPYDLYQDNKDHIEYILWLQRVFLSLYPKLKSGGRLCINIGDGKNGKVPTHADLINALSVKYLPMQMIIWNKGQTSNRASWGSYLSPSAPSLPVPFEYVLIFAKEAYKLSFRGSTDLTKAEFISWTNPLWQIKPETGQKRFGGVAVFPEELPKRLIKLYSWKGAVVCDPYGGAHTTGVACKRLGCSYIGFEISKKYCEIGRKRIAEV